jgi:septal ring factor EnvC (AmiA/AmiB activator)
VAILFSCLPALPSPHYLPVLPHVPGRLSAQAAPEVERINARIEALQREAEQLATQARTLLGELRKLEVERDLQVARLQQAQEAVASAQTEVDRTAARLVQLEETRIAQMPDIKAQLVDLYKQGRAGYARLLFGAHNMRELGRASRAIAAMTTINQRRVQEHQQTLDAVRTDRAALEQKVRDLQQAEAQVRQARDAARRAVASRSALIAQIDARRDLNAQFTGELRVAYDRLREPRLTPGGSRETPDLPLEPFRGALDWPVAGQLVGRFGQPVSRAGTTVSRNGIEVAADGGLVVRAVHPGRVTFAGPFSGFGTLVIVDHGGNDYSLYGYLAMASVEEGDAVGTASELGRVGAAPAGSSGLYFEVRVDGRSVDPLQWLKPR